MAESKATEQQHRDVRVQAVGLAVETVRNARDFTTYQVVHTAALYEDYIWDGKLPPPPGTAPQEPQGAETDA